MPKENENLPFARHIVGTFEHLHFIEDFISGMFMWPEKVIISNPESQVIVGAVDVIKTVRRSVRSLIGTIQSFNHLLERAEFFGYFIVVGKSNYLSDFKLKGFTKLVEKLLGSERIGAVAVSNKTEILWKFR